MSAPGFLAGVCAVILEQGLGRTRAQILARQLEGKGGHVEQALSEKTTHVVIGSNVRPTRLPNLLKVESIPESLAVVRADWLSVCLVKGERVDHSMYVVRPENTKSSPLHSSDFSPAATSTQAKAHSPSKSSRSPLKSSNSPVESPVKCLDVEAVRTSEPDTKKDETSDVASPSTMSATVSPQKVGIFPNSSRRWKGSPKKISVWDTLDSDSDYTASGEEEGEEEQEDQEDQGEKGEEKELQGLPRVGLDPSLPPPAKRKRRWICEIASTDAQSWVNHNQHVTDKLQELLTVYKNNGDKWRAMSTTKAIQALKKHPKEITSYEEARNIPFIGERLADKVWEIVSSGRLRRLEHVDHEKEKTIKMLQKIHGVGQVTAQQFYAQGYRTLEDLQNSGILNRQQQIGVKYYDEFVERMAREEVAEIEAKVREVALSLTPGLEVVTCGSYRRGKPDCGDVDILISHPDGRSHRGLFTNLVQKCTEIGFFTDDLTIHNDPAGGGKYLGVCKLPGEGRKGRLCAEDTIPQFKGNLCTKDVTLNVKHRRIDIYIVPYSEFALALLHFTGSGHFNRSMRHKADLMGMSLSEHSLNTGVIRKNGVKIFDGTPLPVHSEKDVFEYLDIPYCDAKDRDWD